MNTAKMQSQIRRNLEHAWERGSGVVPPPPGPTAEQLSQELAPLRRWVEGLGQGTSEDDL